MWGKDAKGSLYVVYEKQDAVYKGGIYKCSILVYNVGCFIESISTVLQFTL